MWILSGVICILKWMFGKEISKRGEKVTYYLFTCILSCTHVKTIWHFYDNVSLKYSTTLYVFYFRGINVL